MNMKVGTHQLFQNIRNRTQETQADLVKSQTQGSTGQKAQSFSDLPWNLPLVINLQNEVSKITGYQRDISVVDARLTKTSQVLDSVAQRASDFRASIIQALAPGNERGKIDVIADNLKTDLISMLNTDFSGVHLFGGNDIATPPIDPNTPDLYLSNGTYYVGGGSPLQASVDATTVHSYGVKADEPWATKFFSALVRVSQNPTNEAELRIALGEMKTVIDESAGAIATIGHQMKTFEYAKEGHSQIELNINTQLANLTAADLPDVMIQNAQKMNLLESSYLTLSTMKNMSIINYLR